MVSASAYYSSSKEGVWVKFDYMAQPVYGDPLLPNSAQQYHNDDSARDVVHPGGAEKTVRTKSEKRISKHKVVSPRLSITLCLQTFMDTVGSMSVVRSPLEFFEICWSQTCGPIAGLILHLIAPSRRAGNIGREASSCGSTVAFEERAISFCFWYLPQPLAYILYSQHPP
jgi:hypothetical protein